MAMMNADDDNDRLVVVNVDRDLWNVVSTDITSVYTVPSMLLSMTSHEPARKIATSLSLFTHRLSCHHADHSQRHSHSFGTGMEIGSWIWGKWRAEKMDHEIGARNMDNGQTTTATN